MSEDTTEVRSSRTLTRRQFFKAGAAALGIGALGGLAVACTPEEDNNEAKSPAVVAAKTPISQATTPTPLPQDLPPRQALEATATAVVQKGEHTSFVADKEFSREFFERVRASTVKVFVQGEKNGKVEANTSTGWFAKNADGNQVLVTNSHTYHDFDKVSFIEYWRPGIDKYKTTPQGRIVINPMHIPDFAVAKFDMPPQQAPQIEGLIYKDNVR